MQSAGTFAMAPVWGSPFGYEEAMKQFTATATPPNHETRLEVREGLRYPIRLTVLQDGSGNPMPLHGVSKNLTPTGIRVRVSRRVVVGARCRVAFLHAAGRVIPAVIEGTVRNVRRAHGADGLFDLGIEFDRPVQFKQPGKL